MKLKLGVAGIALALGMLAGCFASNRQYAFDLQGCIHSAKSAGDSGAERLAAYNACANALDKDGGQ